MIYYSADTHYAHVNLCKSETKWTHASDDQLRDFPSVKIMNETILSNFNEVIQSEDTLYHLGDVALHGVLNIFEFLEGMNCKNIHLILGNHDHHIINKYYDIDKLFKTVQYHLNITINDIRYVLNHRYIPDWAGKNNGSIHLFGHSHGALKNLPMNCLDVGIDTNNYYPYSEIDIRNRFCLI